MVSLVLYDVVMVISVIKLVIVDLGSSLIPILGLEIGVISSANPIMDHTISIVGVNKQIGG